MKKSLFIVLIIIFIITLVTLFYIDVSRQSRPLAPIKHLNKTNLTLPFEKPIKINPLFITRATLPENTLIKSPVSAQPSTYEKKATPYYITVETCSADTDSPTYLDNRFKNLSEEDRNALSLPKNGCGYIRTKIPFSF